MRQKTDEEILQEVWRSLFGAPKKRGTRSKDPTEFILWKTDGKLFRSRQKALSTGEKPVRHTFDAPCLWESWLNEGYEMHIEDMTHDQYLKVLEKKYKQYHGIE